MIKEINKKLLYIAFSIYVFLLVWIIALKFNASWIPEIGEYFRKMPLKERVGKNMIPFRNMILAFKKGEYLQLDYYMNVVIYIPLGIYLLLLLKFKHKYVITSVIIVVSSFMFEFIQLVTGFGGCDGTDFACNLIGGFIGIMLYLLLIKNLKNKVINIINLVVVILFSPIALYALINTLINIDLYYIPLGK